MLKIVYSNSGLNIFLLVCKLILQRFYVAGPASVTTQAAASQDIRAGVLSGMATSNTDGTTNAVWVNIGWGRARANDE